MPADERYNGWANRETWAVDLWLSSDERMYSMARERINALRAERESDDSDTVDDPDDLRRAVENMLRELTEELLDPTEALLDPGTRDTMLRDIGSLWRVDWNELAAAWLAA